ncbi:MAG: glycosyltransferase, partial [Alphaproteobacteria bacterium HGW-Alphaproteobacteria-9]
MPTEFPTARFLGIDFANMTYAEVAGELDSLSRKDSFSYIVTPNVDHIVQLNEGENDEVAPAFRTAYQSAQLRLCDSRVVQLLARLRSVHVDVVTGSDLTAYLFSEGYLNGRKVALIGGDDKIIEAVQLRYPAVLIDQHQPPMGVLGNPSARSQIVDFIAKGSFDVVLFAIGAPQSEIICHQC